MLKAFWSRVLFHVQVEAIQALLDTRIELFNELLLVRRVLEDAHTGCMIDKIGVEGAFRKRFLDLFMELSILSQERFNIAIFWQED